MTANDRLERFSENNSLSAAWEVLRRRWLIVGGVLLVCVGISAIQQKRAAKSYNATAHVAFQSSTLSEAALQVGSSGSGDPQRDADTQVDIAHSPEVAEGVRKQLGGSSSAEDLLKLVSIEAAPNADVLNITASTGSPRDSATLANAFADQYIFFKTNSQLASIKAAEVQLHQEIAAAPPGSPERTTLGQSVQRLDELRAVAGGGASIIGRAHPPANPSGMRLSTALIIGLLVGLALAFSLVFVIESLDRRIKSIEEFEREYRLSALAAVPQSAMRPVAADERTELLEPYRILRSALDFAAVTRPLDALLVTSAVPGEGKTTVCVDLAHAIALTGRRVVLIELDLRMPTFARHFRLNPHRGITTALVGGQPPSELLVEPLLELPNLSVLPSGRLPHNPSELLGSAAIAEVISELGGGGERMVIIDAPPLNPVADAQVLLNSEAISATLIVARLEATTRDQARRARTILDRHMVEPVGLVITGMRDSSGYGYGYVQYGGAEAPLDADADVMSRSSRSARKPLKL
jgi:capsular exopolysaccharide synthesis family protein